MEYVTGNECDGDYVLRGVRHFDLATILDCGQAFRWSKTEDNTYRGTAFGRCRSITQEGDTLILHGVSGAEFNAVWFDYFDLGRDYGALKEAFSRHSHLREAVGYSPGMRVLRQDGWEALCSFVLSQNNNIPRIKGLVERLCVCFGEEIPGGWAFPRPERLACLTPEELAPVRSGFRAKYLIDAARAVTDGSVDLTALSSLPLEEARAALQTIHGVGPKVAECALLYGFGRFECLPVDVWIGRVLGAWFPQGLPEEILPVAGIAQQYLFHYARNCGEFLSSAAK